MEELDFKRVGPPRKSFTPAAKLTHAEIVAFKAAIFEAEPEGVEYISNLEAENAALKEELKAINAALDDPRTDLTMTACQVIAALKEQVAQLQVTPADKREDLRCVISDICAQARELQETIAQQAEALRVKDTLLSKIAQQTPEKPDYWSSCSQCEWNSSEAEDALAIQPSPDILRERDARLVERINRHLLDIGDNCSDDPLQHIANQIRNGEINV